MPRRDPEAYRAYMKDYMLRRYHERRAKYVAEWGGACVDCGTAEDLDFDHDDATTKTRPVGKMFVSASDEKIREELRLCVLRCQPCHIEKSRRSGDYTRWRLGPLV